jgi:6,7-dimethyl-8-ribityllumazine synthase
VPKEIEGNLVAAGLSFGIVVSRFNDAITERLLEGCVDALVRHGAKESDITCVRVPGAFELPLAAKRLAESGKFNAVICLSALIRGETQHFEFIGSQAARGIAQIGMETNVPVIYGVVTTEDVQQALERSGIKRPNRGAEAAVAAIEMATLMKALSKI